MSTNNAVNVGLSGSTGTGNFVGANTPTLITPVLGAATATSINFGGSSLANYTNFTGFTPNFTFGTPGDLSVNYATQVGAYSTIGNLVFITFIITCTPTYTTSSGTAYISNLPFTVNSTLGAKGSVYLYNVTYPASITEPVLYATLNTKNLAIIGNGSGQTGTFFSTTQFPTATVVSIEGSIIYSV